MCDCINCDELNIPIGPTGATGATGAPGAAGTNGTNGTTVLASYNNLTGVGTNADLLEKVLYTTVVPAGALANNGEEIEIFLNIIFNSVTDATLKFKFGTLFNYSINYPTIGPDLVNSQWRIKITRLTQTTQSWFFQELSSITGGTYIVRTLSDNSSAEDLSNSLTFEITGQNITTAVSNQLVLKKASLYLYIYAI